jgi:hypothetical protein
MLAQCVSTGFTNKNRSSPGGATDSSFLTIARKVYHLLILLHAP